MLKGKECLVRAHAILTLGYTPSLFYPAFNAAGEGLNWVCHPAAVSFNIHGAITKANKGIFDVGTYDILRHGLGLPKPSGERYTMNVDDWARKQPPAEALAAIARVAAGT